MTRPWPGRWQELLRHRAAYPGSRSRSSAVGTRTDGVAAPTGRWNRIPSASADRRSTTWQSGRDTRVLTDAPLPRSLPASGFGHAGLGEMNSAGRIEFLIVWVRYSAASEIQRHLTPIRGVNALKSPERATILVTHYQRLLDHIVPDRVHVLSGGRIATSGGQELALELGLWRNRRRSSPI